jgi:hypothetical protein
MKEDVKIRNISGYACYYSVQSSILPPWKAKVYKVLVGKPELKRPLGRPRRRWEDDIRVDLRETGWGGCRLDSTGGGYGPMASCCECDDKLSGSWATELVSQSDVTFLNVFLHHPPFSVY